MELREQAKLMFYRANQLATEYARRPPEPVVPDTYDDIQW
jgi:hypothetical protein